MSVYITGDCHGDWRRFSSRNFPEQKQMSRDDFVIVCGDFGLWHDTKEEQNWLDWLAEKSFTLLFVDGNHENFDRLYGDEFEVIDFHGGKAHKIRENIFHLMRGYVFKLCGKKFFAFGGASSHDIDDGILDPKDFDTTEELIYTANEWVRERKMFRIKGVSWWSQELPTIEEMEHGKKSLEENNNEVDYVITHCCPQTIASVLSRGLYKHDSLTSYFNEIMENVKFTKWYCGHYHKDSVLFDKFVMKYEDIERVI